MHSIVAKQEEDTKKEIESLKEKFVKLRESLPSPETLNKLESFKQTPLKEAAYKPEGNVSTAGESRKSEEYARARRSVKIWPVVQSSALSIENAARNFLSEMLRIPESSIGHEEIETIARPKMKKKRYAESERPGQVHHETVITFKNAATRDFVMGHAYNLAQHVDENNKPTAGIRMEIPHHLLSQFHDLQNYARDLHTKHGTGFKRNIKFEDREENLFMYVKLPNSEEWLFVDHAIALEERRTRLLRSTAATRQKLGQEQGSTRGTPSVSAPPKLLPESTTLSKFTKASRRTETEWE